MNETAIFLIKYAPDRQPQILKWWGYYEIFYSKFLTKSIVILTALFSYANLMNEGAYAQGVNIDYIQSDPVSNGIFKYPWRKADLEKRQIIFNLGWIDGKYSIDQDTAISITSLPFYDQVEMISVKKSEMDRQESLHLFFDR